MTHPFAGPRRFAWKTLLFVLLALFAATGRAAPPAAVLRADSGDVRVHGTVELLHEAAGEPLTREQVLSPGMATRWTVSPGKTINMARDEHPVWVRFAVRNEAPAARTWALGIAWPMIDRIEFHPRDPTTGAWGDTVVAGLEVGAAGKLFRDPAFVFPLAIPTGETREYLMRFTHHTAYLIPLVVSDAADLQRRRFDSSVVMGVLFGIIGVMFLYNLSLAAFVREKSYVAYSAYLLSVLLYELTVTGYGAMYVWTDNAWIRRHDYEVFSSASFLCASIFFRYFLDLTRTRPVHLRHLNAGLIIYWAATLMASLVWPNRALFNLSALVGLFTTAVGIYISVVLSLKGNRFARYFLVAWAMVAAGTVASVSAVLGFIEGTWFTDNAQHIGFALEILLLSVLLAERIRRERDSRAAAQREALELTERVKAEREEKIRAQEHAIALQARANEDLERRVLDRTADVELAMKNLEAANVELARLSVTDALTKVHNRRYFDEALAKEYDRSARTHVPMAVMLVDIDHFKRVNDTCGHLAGDECLRLVAATLRATVGRSTDLVARFGGEEFALVLPGTDASRAAALAERLREAVERIEFTYGEQRVPLTASIGVAARTVSHTQPAAEFLAEADAALYRAKDAGRNRVVLAGPTGEGG